MPQRRPLSCSLHAECNIHALIHVLVWACGQGDGKVLQDSRRRFCRALKRGAALPLRHACQAAGGGVSGLRYDQGYSTETATVTRLRPAPLEA